RLGQRGEREAELGGVAGAGAPAAGPAGRQLDAHADDRPHLQRLGVTDDQLQLGELLDDGDDLFADLAGQHGHLDELVVLEAVADDRRAVLLAALAGATSRAAAVGQGQHREQLGLAAGLDPEVVGLAEGEDLLDDLALLVDLDGVDADVTAPVLVLLDGLLEGLVEFADAVPQHVGEAQQDRQLDAARLQLIDQVLEIDVTVGPLGRMHEQMAGPTDLEVALAPVSHALDFEVAL